MDVDNIIENELGQFGRFQQRLTVLCMIASIFASLAAAEYLFTTARIKTRCKIHECDSNSSEFYSPWVHNAIPEVSGSIANCHRFVGNSSQSIGNETCPATLFDKSKIESCNEYVYENKNTIVYDFNMACAEWRRTLIGSLRWFGMLIALPMTGYISDHWGRRMALTITSFNCAWLGATRYFTNTYIGFTFSEVLESTFGSGIFTSAYILLIEFMSTKYRTAAGATMSTFWAVGQMILAMIAWAVPNWRNLTLTLFVPQLFTISFLWIMPESPRWYISTGRFKEAEEILKRVAKINRKTVCLSSLETLRPSVEEDQEVEQKEPCLIILLFRHKKILLRCVVAPVWWITSMLIYYGLSINAINMSGNAYLNYVAVSAVEIPGYWIAVLLIDRIGRKPVLTGAFWICGACQVAFIFIPRDIYGLSLTFFLVGKSSISVVTSAIYIYTAELYPTKHRHTLFAFTSMVGRVGSIVAPLTPAIGAATFDEFPFVLFASCALISGLLMFLTPETLGTKLPDTMEEAENFLQEHLR